MRSSTRLPVLLVVLAACRREPTTELPAAELSSDAPDRPLVAAAATPGEDLEPGSESDPATYLAALRTREERLGEISVKLERIGTLTAAAPDGVLRREGAEEVLTLVDGIEADLQVLERLPEQAIADMANYFVESRKALSDLGAKARILITADPNRKPTPVEASASVQVVAGALQQAGGYETYCVKLKFYGDCEVGAHSATEAEKLCVPGDGEVLHTRRGACPLAKTGGVKACGCDVTRCLDPTKYDSPGFIECVKSEACGWNDNDFRNCQGRLQSLCDQKCEENSGPVDQCKREACKGINAF